MTRNRLTLILVLVTAFSLLTIGCSHDSATTNTTTEFDDQGALDNLVLTELLQEELEEQQETFAKQNNDQKVQLPLSVQTYGEAEYEDDGFTISLDFDIEGNDIEVDFEFPSNSVNAATAYLLATNDTISITGEAVLSLNGSWVFFYECTPHGLVFDNPVLVSQEVEEDDNILMGLFYNVDGRYYSLEEVSLVENDLVEFHLWHFSKYGISR